jgi:hypothetical protein
VNSNFRLLTVRFTPGSSSELVVTCATREATSFKDDDSEGSYRLRASNAEPALEALGRAMAVQINSPMVAI